MLVSTNCLTFGSTQCRAITRCDFALTADHPDLVHRLVIHSSAYTLGECGRQLQLEVGKLAQQRRWAQTYIVLFNTVLLRTGIKRLILKPRLWLGAQMMTLDAP